MNITEYKIVSAQSSPDLATKVNAEIKNGFQPWGSVQILYTNSWQFFQPMVASKATAPTKASDYGSGGAH